MTNNIWRAEKRPSRTIWQEGKNKSDQRETGALTLGKSEAISVTAEWIFSEHGTKLRTTE